MIHLRRLSARQGVQHASIVFAATAMVNAANFAFHFGSVRLLGIADYGALAAILAMLLVASVPATVLQAVVAATVGELSAKHDLATLMRLGMRLLQYALIGAAAVVALGFFVARPVSAYLALDDVTAVDLAFSWLGLFIAVNVLRGVLQGAQLFRALAASLLIEACGNVTFGLGVILVHGGVRGALIGYVLAVSTALAYSALRVRTTVRSDVVVLDLQRLMAKFAGTAVALFALAAMAWSDVMLVRHFAPPAAAGLYGALSIFGKIVLFSISFLPVVLLPKVSRIGRRGADARAMLARTLIAGGVMCAAQLLVIEAAPKVVLGIVAGRAALPAAPLLPAYGVAISALALSTIVAHYNVGLHRFSFVLPLALTEIGEIIAIYHFHDSLMQVVDVVVVGHTTALVLVVLTTALAELRASLRARRGSAEQGLSAEPANRPARPVSTAEPLRNGTSTKASEAAR